MKRLMLVVTVPAKIAGYLAEGALEVFSPNHDSYPEIGVQPFSGEISSSSPETFSSQLPAKAVTQA